MSSAMAGRGRPGPQGPQGPMGPTGPQGPAAFSLAIGEVGAVAYGQQPEVTNVGTDQDQVWDLKLVTGATGVLTGPQPPTGTDGTSLGQLYFCTSNGVYYGLVSLSENDNKWRPLMTNVSSTRRVYNLDVVDKLDYEPGTGVVVGHICVIMDDLKEEMIVKPNFYMSVAVGAHFHRLYLGMQSWTRLVADAAANGITSIPIPVSKVVNGVTTSSNRDLSVSDGEVYSLVDLCPSSDGTGAKPGHLLSWNDDGSLVAEVNDTGAPAGAVYGDAVPNGGADKTMCVAGGYQSDATYPTTYASTATVVIPYA